MTSPLPIRVVSQEDAEKAAFYVCNRVGCPSHFVDDRIGVCAHCHHPIYFRPHAPVAPVKICLECAIDLGRGGRA